MAFQALSTATFGGSNASVDCFLDGMSLHYAPSTREAAGMGNACWYPLRMWANRQRGEVVSVHSVRI